MRNNFRLRHVDCEKKRFGFVSHYYYYLHFARLRINSSGTEGVIFKCERHKGEEGGGDLL